MMPVPMVNPQELYSRPSVISPPVAKKPRVNPEEELQSPIYQMLSDLMKQQKEMITALAAVTNQVQVTNCNLANVAAIQAKILTGQQHIRTNIGRGQLDSMLYPTGYYAIMDPAPAPPTGPQPGAPPTEPQPGAPPTGPQPGAY